MLQWAYDACRAAQDVLSKKNLSSQVKILAPHDDVALHQFCGEHLLSYLAPFCDEQDVLRRYHLALEEVKADSVIRITADCWQTHPQLVVEVAEMLLKEKADYASNTIHRSFMEGLDVQGCSKRALAWFDQHQQEKREHPFYDFDHNERVREEFDRAGMRYLELVNPHALHLVRTSIDTVENLEFARRLYEQSQNPELRMEGTSEKRARPRPDGNKLEALEPIR